MRIIGSQWACSETAFCCVSAVQSYLCSLRDANTESTGEAQNLNLASVKFADGFGVVLTQRHGYAWIDIVCQAQRKSRALWVAEVLVLEQTFEHRAFPRSTLGKFVVRS